MSKARALLLKNKPALAVTALFVVTFVIANFADRDVFHNVHITDVYDTDWGKALRTVGYLPLWLAIAAGLALIDRDRQRGRGFAVICRRGAMVALSSIAGGLMAEILKMLCRRERPREHDGLHVFRPWDVDLLSTSGLGLPSSHTMVAFAGAMAMSLLYPRTAVIWLLAAAGCAWTRVLNQDHFFSDVVLGAFAGAACAWALWVFVFQPPTKTLPEVETV